MINYQYRELHYRLHQQTQHLIKFLKTFFHVLHNQGQLKPEINISYISNPFDFFIISKDFTWSKKAAKNRLTVCEALAECV